MVYFEIRSLMSINLVEKIGKPGEQRLEQSTMFAIALLVSAWALNLYGKRNRFDRVSA
jgi:hypothetical protein